MEDRRLTRGWEARSGPCWVGVTLRSETGHARGVWGSITGMITFLEVLFLLAPLACEEDVDEGGAKIEREEVCFLRSWKQNIFPLFVVQWAHIQIGVIGGNQT